MGSHESVAYTPSPSNKKDQAPSETLGLFLIPGALSGALCRALCGFLFVPLALLRGRVPLARLRLLLERRRELPLRRHHHLPPSPTSTPPQEPKHASQQGEIPFFNMRFPVISTPRTPQIS